MPRLSAVIWRPLDVLRTESARADIVVTLADAFLDVANPNTYDEVIRIDGAAMDAIAEGLKGDR